MTAFSVVEQDRSTRDWIDAPLVVAMLLITNVLMSAAKLTYSDTTDGSFVGQLTFTAIYVAAVVRFANIGSEAWWLVKRSAPLIVFLALNLLSTFWSANPILTLKQSIELLGTTTVAYYIVARFTLHEFLRLLCIVYGAISVVSLLLVVGAPGRGRDNWGGGPFSGIYSNKNALGAVMALAIVTLVPLILQSKGTRRAWLIALLALCAVLLFGSNSVTATMTCLGACVALLIALSCTSERYGSRARIASIVGGTFLAGAVVIVAFGLFGLDAGVVLGALGRQPDLTGRTDFWPGIIEAIKDRPVLGYGYNAFFYLGGPYLDYLAQYVASSGFTPSHAHNSCLQILLGTGVVGLSLFLVILLVALRRTIANVGGHSGPIRGWPLMIIVFLLLGSYSETYFGVYNTLEWILFVAAFLYPIRQMPGTTALRERSK